MSLGRVYSGDDETGLVTNWQITSAQTEIIFPGFMLNTVIRYQADQVRHESWLRQAGRQADECF